MLKRKAYSKPLEKQVKFFLSSQKKINALRHRLVICLNVISMFHFNFKVLRYSSSTDITAQETDFLSKYDQILFPSDLVTSTEEILNGKLHFLCHV